MSIQVFEGNFRDIVTLELVQIGHNIHIHILKQF